MEKEGGNFSWRDERDEIIFRDMAGKGHGKEVV